MNQALEPMRWFLSFTSFIYDKTVDQCQKVLSDDSEDGKWILKKPEYLEWRSGGLQSLWCCGPRKWNKTYQHSMILMAGLISGSGENRSLVSVILLA